MKGGIAMAGRWAGRVRQLGYAAAMGPLGAVEVASPGAADPVGRWERVAGGRLAPEAGTSDQSGGGQSGDRRPGPGRVLGHAALSVVLGLVAWVLLAGVVLMVARGLFYGFVDPGPYDTSWGGPSKAGAWVAHAALATPTALVGLVMVYGIARLHQRLTRGLLGGGRSSPWSIVLVGAIAVAMVLLIVGFIGQL